MFRLSEQMKALIAKAKANADGTATCDPRAMYPMGHKCAATTSPVTGKIQPPWIGIAGPIDAGGVPIPDKAIITKRVPLSNGGAVTQIQTGNGETVKATIAPNGAVEKVEVQNKWLMPAALAAAAFILFGG